MLRSFGHFAYKLGDLLFWDAFKCEYLILQFYDLQAFAFHLPVRILNNVLLLHRQLKYLLLELNLHLILCFQLRDVLLSLRFEFLLVILHRCFQSIQLASHPLLQRLRLRLFLHFKVVILSLKIANNISFFDWFLPYLIWILTESLDQAIILLRFFIEFLNYFLGLLAPLSHRCQVVPQCLYTSLQLVILALLFIQLLQQLCLHLLHIYLCIHFAHIFYLRKTLPQSIRILPNRKLTLQLLLQLMQIKLQLLILIYHLLQLLLLIIKLTTQLIVTLTRFSQLTLYYPQLLPIFI